MQHTIPIRERSSAIQWLQRVLLLAIAVSLGTFGFAAWLGYASVMREAQQKVDQLARLARGHALDTLRHGPVDTFPDHSEFYRGVFGADRSIWVNLFHRNGTLVARYPPDAPAPPNLPPHSPVVQAIDAGIASGVRKVRSPDGRSRLVAFQTIDPYPYVVHVALDYSALLGAWHHDLVIHATFLFSALLCLVMIARLAIGRARREHAAVRQWRDELARNAAMADELRQAHKLEAIGQLTSGIAHDFKNLLHTVGLNAQLLQAELRGRGDPDALGSIARAVESGTRLIEHLLAFSRRQVLHPVPVELTRELPLMCDLLKASLPPNIKLSAAPARDTWPIEVDRTELELALLNLTVNARDAMPRGGNVTIATRNVPEREGELYEVGLLEGDFVAVSVSDTGEGIPPDILYRVFDPFFTTKEPGRGTGLGLSRIHGFAHQSGGKVRARNLPGGGAIMTLYFPRFQPPAAGAGRASLAPAQLLGS